MARLLEWIKQPFKKILPLSPGIYQYQAPPDSPLNYRLHLRVEEAGTGLLIINASTVLHLNQTATEYIYHIIKQTHQEEAIKIIRSRYQASREQIEEDFIQIQQKIEEMILTPDLDPVTFLDIERHIPYTGDITAPYRIDCAITYSTADGVELDSAPHKRVDRELSTTEWKEIINNAWQAGIPHIIFTGGEPTLRDDLVELIRYAEEIGQVTGLLTDGIKLKDTNYLKELLDAGLDHTMIVLQPTNQESWDSLTSFSYWSKIMEEDIFVSAHLTITDNNKDDIETIIKRLASTGISAISLSTPNESLKTVLRNAQEFVYEHNLDLVWDIPVPYSSNNPISAELETEDNEQVVFGEAHGWLYIEPDGDVLPTQGINQIFGNMILDSWEKIWRNAKEFRTKS